MSNKSKYYAYAAGMIASIFLPVFLIVVLAACLSISFDCSIIVGLVIAVPVFIYCVVKMVQCNKMQSDKLMVDFYDSHGSASLPDKPVYVDKDSAFVFPKLKDDVRWYFKDLWKTTMEYGWIDVLYGGKIILQIWNFPENGKKHNVLINFNPYSYNSSLVQRFKSCVYYKDFAENDSENDNFMQASYGKDIDKALIVASYILVNVYYIPTTYPIQIKAEKPQERWPV